MQKQQLAASLICFLKQNQDFETKAVLKTLRLEPKTQLRSIPSSPVASPVIAARVIEPVKKDIPPLPSVQKAKEEMKFDAEQALYQKLMPRIKKACPELRIKPLKGLSKASLPDCDVILLSESLIPDVYQSLIKAIDKQLALTEAVFLEPSLMEEFLIKNFRLILAPPFTKKLKYFQSFIKKSADLQTNYLGSTEVIFLDEPDVLMQLSKKQVLWQQIKSRLA